MKIVSLILGLIVFVPNSVTASEVEQLTPVLIIPGIMGSELYENDELIWPDLVRLVGNPFDGFLSESLRLDQNGNSIRQIKAKAVIKKILTSDTFEGLIDELTANGYVLGENLFLFPYDWRLDLNQTRHLLAVAINSILSLSGAEKVDIIAHSMGGLLAKNYVEEYGGSLVQRFITVGTPHLGAPKSFNVLMSGDLDIPFGVVNASRIKEIAINSPAIYQLLPNIVFIPSTSRYLVTVIDGITQELNYDEINQFLVDMGKNESLINRARNLHNALLTTSINGVFDGVETHNIIGCKNPTQYTYYINPVTGSILYTKYGTGDGTVPLMSGMVFNSIKYFVPNVSHVDLPANENIRQLIASILKGVPQPSSLIMPQQDNCVLNGKTLNWRSPVEVHVYDQLGNHSGLSLDGIVENNIPGAAFDMIDGHVYIFLPTDAGQVYFIEGTGTDNGTFDLITADVINGETLNSVLYDNVPVIMGSRIEIEISNSSDNQLLVSNQEGDFQPVIPVGEFESIGQLLAMAMIKIEPVVLEEEFVAQDDPQSVFSGGGGLVVDTQPSEQVIGQVLGESINKFRDSTLVLDTSDNQTIYIIGSGGKRFGFASAEVFLNLGFSFGQVITGDLSQYDFGGLVETIESHHPNGSVIYDGQTIWLINHDMIYGFTTMHEFLSKGFVIEQVINSNKYDELLIQQKTRPPAGGRV
jgi:pimeloyl-ACP methyl ester carboxylesterase